MDSSIIKVKINRTKLHPPQTKKPGQNPFSLVMNYVCETNDVLQISQIGKINNAQTHDCQLEFQKKPQAPSILPGYYAKRKKQKVVPSASGYDLGTAPVSHLLFRNHHSLYPCCFPLMATAPYFADLNFGQQSLFHEWKYRSFSD